MISLRILRTSGIEYDDLVPCLDNVAPNDRFISHGRHYSPLGSIAIARCLHSVVVKKLPGRDNELNVRSMVREGEYRPLLRFSDRHPLPGSGPSVRFGQTISDVP